MLPDKVGVIGVLRTSGLVGASEAGVLRRSDVVMLIAPDEEVDHLSEMFTQVETAVRRAAWGDFMLDASASVADICAAYGAEAPPEFVGLNLDEAMRELAPRIVVGDEVRMGRLARVAREIADGKVVRAGLKLIH